MTSTEVELNNFIENSLELINSNYILADIKIVGVLKSIAMSDTLLALIKNCLTGFDYEEAKKKYFVKNEFLAKGKKVFVLPESKKDIIALSFLTLMDIDKKEVDFASFLDTNFFESGSTFISYNGFINQMIKPFVTVVKSLIEDVMNGLVQDPNEALEKIEEQKKEEARQEENEKKIEAELVAKSFGEKMTKVRRILVGLKKDFLSSSLSDVEKAERSLVIDGLLKALDKQNKDDITYAFLCYTYMAKNHANKKQFKVKEMRSLLSDIIFEI